MGWKARCEPAANRCEVLEGAKTRRWGTYLPTVVLVREPRDRKLHVPNGETESKHVYEGTNER